MRSASWQSILDGIASLFRSSVIVVIACCLSACQSIGYYDPSPEWRDTTALADARTGHAMSGALTSPNVAPDRPTLEHIGTGSLVGIPDAAGASRVPATGGITVNLNDVSVEHAAKVVLGDILKRNYLVDPKVSGKVTLNLTTPIARRDLPAAFDSALSMIGAAVVDGGALLKVVPVDAAKRSGTGIEAIGDATIGSGAVIVPLRFVAATELKRLLEPLAPNGGVAVADNVRNALALVGTPDEIANMRRAIAVFDVDVMRGMSFAQVPVRSADPDAIASQARAVLGTEKGGPAAGMVKLLPNKSLKSIVVISPQPAYLRRAERLIRNLDAGGVGPERQAFSYAVQNRPAKELIQIVSGIFGAPTGSGAA
ncbi:MAG: type II secretion system protein GspD, partial [Hyphomicrobiales bacterium]|nr:type II secretion system protein GspD [Hyphomicrobiales bacterium]